MLPFAIVLNFYINILNLFLIILILPIIHAKYLAIKRILKNKKNVLLEITICLL